VDEEEELGEEVEEEEEEGKEEDKEAALGFEEGGEGVGRRRARDAGYELSFVTRWQQRVGRPSRSLRRRFRSSVSTRATPTVAEAKCYLHLVLLAPRGRHASGLGSRVSLRYEGSVGLVAGCCGCGGGWGGPGEAGGRLRGGRRGRGRRRWQRRAMA
jgi:hypothetical protein